MSTVTTNLENFALQLLATADITSGVNPGLTIVLFLLVLLAEANILVPVLIESIWLVVGYQSGTNALSVLNTVFLLILAQIARQLAVTGVYYLVALINTPISRLYVKLWQRKSFHRKWMDNQPLYDLRFLSTFSAALGMLTPLSALLKITLVLKRRLKVLLLGTLFSGAAFDILYILLGAVFHTTTLQLTYLPMFLLAGFLTFTLLKLIGRKQRRVLP